MAGRRRFCSIPSRLLSQWKYPSLLETICLGGDVEREDAALMCTHGIIGKENMSGLLVEPGSKTVYRVQVRGGVERPFSADL